jgi:hypothetical protein
MHNQDPASFHGYVNPPAFIAVHLRGAPLILGSVWALPNLARGAQRFVEAPFGHGVAPWLTKAATATQRREESAIAAVMKIFAAVHSRPLIGEWGDESICFTFMSSMKKVYLSIFLHGKLIELPKEWLLCVERR